MLINAVTYTFPEDKIDRAVELFRQLRADALQEEGCVSFDVCRGDADAPTTVLLYEKWRDQAALDAHYRTDSFQRLGVNGVRPLAAGRTAVKGTPVE